LVGALAAIANGGKLMKPQLVKEIRTAQGQLVKEIEPEVGQEVISKDTAKQLAGILEKVVSQGTGRNAFLEEYRVAGKTGTAQKAGPGGYMQGKYVASFAGFAPADDPRVAVLVVIDEPQGGIYYGGQIAAPVFRDVVRDILRYLNIPPQVRPEDIKEDAQKREIMVPDVVNTSLDEAQQILRQAGLKSRIEGSGSWVLNQQPKAGGRVNINTQVILYVGRDAKEIPAGQEVTMPDVSGLTMREAGKLLGRLGLRMDPQGSGIAVSQKVAPGTKIKAGTAVTVTFESPAPDAEP
jgi:stage V sporulation protein D (sporulation-specific penicillin-binding protein)